MDEVWELHASMVRCASASDDKTIKLWQRDGTLLAAAGHSAE